MRVLLDTHAFLWWAEDSAKLPGRARKIIADPENQCLVSHVCAWEIAIKSGIGKLKIPGPLGIFFPREMQTHGFEPLRIDFRAIARVEGLPFHHRDPFDRLLIAQALEEKLPVVTADTVFRKYGVKRIW